MMAGGTLAVSREVNNHLYYKKRLEAAGFPAVTVTALEKDALNSLVRNLKPNFLIMDARFYQCCTPFLMGGLKESFPKINMAAVSIGEYPADLAMYFIFNGVTSYVSSFDGIEELFVHLAEIRKGGGYVSPAVLKRIDMRGEYPMAAGKITERHKQIILLLCNGFKDVEIAETLFITRRTVTTHKTQIFTSLNVRSPNELIRVALYLEIVKLDGMYFYPKDFVINPLPDEKILKRNKRAMNNEKKSGNKVYGGKVL
jgi:DNA-binding NarL/FixJ family response regulator